MAIKVGRWDCQSCGQKKILGPKTQCPNCNDSRPKDVKFYLTTDAEEVESEEELSKAMAGADWVCSSCGTHNKNWDTACYNCNHSKKISVREDTELKTKEHLFDEKVEEQDEFVKHFQRSPYKDWRQYGYKRLYNGKENKLPGFLRGIIKRIRGLFVTIMAGLAMIFSFILEKQIEVPVQEVKWERSISYEEFKNVEEEDWKLPKGAKLISEFEDVHHTDKKVKGYKTKTKTVKEKVGTEEYVCGTKDLGNGYFEDIYCERDIYEDREEEYEAPIYEEIPVYQTKYKYSINKWVDAEPLKTSGLDKKPRWADRSVFSQSQSLREKGTKENYYITVLGPKENKWKHHVTYDYWQKINVGDKVKAKKKRIWGTYIGLLEGEID